MVCTEVSLDVLPTLNNEFTPLSFEARIQRFYQLFPAEQVLATSSFGTSSALLLYHLHRYAPDQRIHFLDTTFHFAETIAYREQLTQLFGLNVEVVRPDQKRNQLARQHRMWKNQAKRCCHYNKVLPLRTLKARYQVWISGLLGFQTGHRSKLSVFEVRDGLLKFHPFIDMAEGEFLFYFGLYKLPSHPLSELGYGSVGCTHCTSRGAGREGRWQGQTKEECGLHL